MEDSECKVPFEYCFVDETDLLLLKLLLNQKHLEEKESKKLERSLVHYNENEPIVEEYKKFLKSKFSPTITSLLDMKMVMLHRLNIYIDGMNKNTASDLHREFGPGSGDYAYNLIYYYKVENCDPMTSGTGVAFLDNTGKKHYLVLPAIEGLMIIVRDKCMLHHTPKLTALDSSQPIIRTLIRDYIGTYEPNDMLESIPVHMWDEVVKNKYLYYKNKYLELKSYIK